jgi:hypothetical protein
MKVIQHIELGADAASITFSSIPQTFKDLILLMSARTDRSASDGDPVLVRPNGDQDYLFNRRLVGNGSTRSTFTGASAYGGQATANNQTASVFGSSTLYINGYTSSYYKGFIMTGIAENNAAQNTTNQTTSINRYSLTSPITSLVLLPENGTVLRQYTSATLYGVGA